MAEAHGALRRELRGVPGRQGAAVRLLCGGSVEPDDARELAATAGVDGSLVGGAGLKARNVLATAAAFG